MLHSPPKASYCGLTVVMSNQSRFDNVDLLTANGGQFFSEVCLRPDFNRYQCEVRLKENRTALLPSTKVVLLLGQSAAQSWLNNNANTLNEIRGAPYIVNGIPHIASYLPQDCVDMRDHESKHNELADGYEDDDYEGDDEDENSDVSSDKKRHGKTKRRNYGFWLKKDVEKCKYLLKNPSLAIDEPNIHIYPQAEQVIELLTKRKDEFLFFDMETDSHLNITCFAFSYDPFNIYVVPCLLPDYSYGYTALPQIFRALAIGIRDNTLVAHNGANFDFFVLAHKLRIPIGRRVYDTMLAHNRCYPEMEKSLGHCISLYTWLKFHKDLGDVPYNSLTNAQQVWNYCGLDVYSMALVKQGIDKHAARTPGVKESIEQANKSIRPYLITTLQGIRYNKHELDRAVRENDRLMMQYLRWLDILIGAETLKIIRGKGKSSMPSSNPQCVKYFHDLLGYPVISRGKEKKDGTKNPSLGKKNLFKLRLKQENAVIDICLAYRELSKESGSLRFTPYKTNEPTNTTV